MNVRKYFDPGTPVFVILPFMKTMELSDEPMVSGLNGDIPCIFGIGGRP